ncbi:vWA domain-containing protein [Vacuolonema iberomarrocanum]|uniref:vWA domain-containing protein n=1 Tax=Vacuolonema iberomarrocanum TaxID=3454632 RepID=UPI0019EB650A|nr:VWA domain-containing protein [filamentous cyanobacterium LEGE 07170]
MKVGLQAALSDGNLDVSQASSQRQLAVSLSAIADATSRSAPLNLCLILDHSGSMAGRPLETVKQATHQILESLSPGDRISIVVFDHKAKVLVPNQVVDHPSSLKMQVNKLAPSGGTAIDEGMRLGIEELAKAKQDTISQALLLTDGENEHGDNDRCLKLAELAANYNLTLSTLGFGDHWNQDVLEKIADAAGGTLAYIQKPEQAMAEFNRLFERMQSVALVNARLNVQLMPNVRLAEMKPLAQVVPETVELTPTMDGDLVSVRLGDLMVDTPRVVLVNLYAGAFSEGTHPLATVQVRYDDPSQNKEGLLSDAVTVSATAIAQYQAVQDAQVQKHVLALAKYRQTQIAETKLQHGDRTGAATMLQTAAKTALQMGDKSGATVLQESATQLEQGKDLSEGDRKKTRMVSKTILQGQ